MGLIEKAKKYDKERIRDAYKKKCSDDEIMLVGAWFEGDISTGAIADVLGVHKGNIYQRASTILKAGIATGRVGFVWFPKEGVRDENKGK